MLYVHTRRRVARRRPFRLLVAGLVVGLAAVGCTPDEDARPGRTGVDPPPTAVEQEPAGLSGSSTVSYADSASWLDGMSAEDRLEQIRDWTVVGLATLLELDVEAARNAFYDKTSLRDPVFAGVDDARVGPGRSLADGRGTLHVLVPADDPHATRTIGLLLDDYRKDAGNDERSVQVHRYTIDEQRLQVDLSSDEPMPTDEVRSAHGYVEMKLDQRSALTEFLSVVRHVSRFEVRNGELWAGGWAWGDDIPSGVVTPEDIAVLVRGYLDTSTTPGFSLDPAPETSLEDLQAVVPDADPTVLERLWNERPRPTTAEDEPGYVCDELVSVAAQERAAGSDDLIIENAQSILECLLFEAVGLDAAPSVGLPADRTQLWAVSSWLEGHGSHAVARYDGGLAGTEVGMTLFYTDMVAKDWVVGVGSGMPSQAVPGFHADTETDIPWGHCDDAGAASGRLWFGQDDTAFSLGDGALDIGSVATRLFSRSDSTHGEVEPSFRSGRGLRWWDRHYVAIADYEPQYHRLDQLMRWSAALEWAFYDQQWAGFVLPVDPTTPSPRFDDWYRAHGELRERAELTFVSPPGATTEGLMAKPTPPFEVCRRPLIRGGVSLGDMVLRRELAARVGLLADDLPSGIRRAGTFGAETAFDSSRGTGIVDKITIAADGTIVDQVTRRITSLDDISVKVDVEAYGTRAAAIGDVKIARDVAATRHVETTIDAANGALARSYAVDGFELGQLSATRVNAGALISWEPGVLDHIRRAGSGIQRALGGGSSLDDAVRTAPDITMAVKDPVTGSWHVRTPGDPPSWFVLDDGADGTGALDLQIGVPAPDGTIIPMQLHPQAPVLMLDGQPATWYRIADDAGNGAAGLEGAAAPSAGRTVNIVRRDGREGSYVVADGQVLARVDDPVFGRDGTQAGIAMMRRHAEVEAAEVAAASDGYLRAIVLGDDGAVVVGPEGRVLLAADEEWTRTIQLSPTAADGGPGSFRIVGDQLHSIDPTPLLAATDRTTGWLRDLRPSNSEMPTAYIHADLAKRLASEEGLVPLSALDQDLYVVVERRPLANPVVSALAPDVRVHAGAAWQRVDVPYTIATAATTILLISLAGSCPVGDTETCSSVPVPD